MLKRIHNTFNQNPVLFVLVSGGLSGIILGLSNATWQVSVETGQVLAGIVKYPVDNPNYMYHIKVFTIVNQLSALLLYVIDSERIVSILISGLLGMISLQALSMFIFAINRDIYISVLGSIFIYFINYVGKGVIYPIWLLGSPHTYGILGLSFIVLVIALIGAKVYRLGLFCLGLAPSIHPSLGAWLFLIIFSASLFQLGFVKKVIKAHYWYFIAGIFISISSLIYQLHLMQVLPVINPELEDQYIASFIKYWDQHRVKFYWDYKTQKLSFIKEGVVYCIYSIIVGLLSLLYFKSRNSLSFMFRVIVIAGCLSLLLAGFTHIPQEIIPKYLLILMPGRYVNLNNIILGASLLGVLTYYISRHYNMNYSILVLVLLIGLFVLRGRSIVVFPLILLWFAYIVATQYPSKQGFSFAYGRPILNVLRFTRSFFKREPFILAGRNLSKYGKILTISLMTFWVVRFSLNADFNRSNFIDRTNDSFLSIISERKGILAATAHFFMLSLRTRRPILVDVAALDGFNMVPESGKVLNNILKKVYGVDLLIPPPRYYQHWASIHPGLHRRLWERRTVKEWQKIRKEFGVTDILTTRDWRLSLPIVSYNRKMILYEIPSV